MFCEFFGERGGMWFLAVFRELELIRCIVFSCYDFSYGSPKYIFKTPLCTEPCQALQ